MSDLERYEPRHEKLWHNRADGGFEARIYTDEGIVDVFSFPGDGRHQAFCKFEMFIHPHVYTRRLPRHYHQRWIRRLAYQFAWDCSKHASENPQE
jgi:hypothetical protein